MERVTIPNEREERIIIDNKQAGENCKLVGILHRSDSPASSSTQGKPLVLILHGILAHKNQSYHPLLASRLASERGLDSFRYDLRAQGGESDGEWGMANFEDDVDDIETVVDEMKIRFGYRVHCIIGHSRGSMVSFNYLSTRIHHSIPLYVNVSGRYDMSRVLENPKYNEEFFKIGYEDWDVKIAGKRVKRRILAKFVREFAEFDNSYIIESFPQETHVLNIHGIDDSVVPVADAHTLHKILSQRRKGTSTLTTMKGPDHNWTRPFDEPVNGIMNWLAKVDPLCPRNGASSSEESKKAKL